MQLAKDFIFSDQSEIMTFAEYFNNLAIGFQKSESASCVQLTCALPHNYFINIIMLILLTYV